MLLGISDSQHKQKIQLRAMDVVLFGPPNGGEPYADTLSNTNNLKTETLV